jgi:CheY-like chemotaxis protein
MTLGATQTAARTTLLVADDDEGVLAFVCRLLEQDGHTVIRAHDGAEALTLARQHGKDICVLLTDIRMPGLGGRELAAAVVRAHPHIRIIYMTGFADEQFERGTVALRKPFRPDALRAAVTRSSKRCRR